MSDDLVAITKVRCRSLGGLRSELTVKDHAPLVSDEPADFAVDALVGTDTGWTPVQYQLAGLIACANVAVALTAQVQAELVHAVERADHHEVEQRAVALRQRRPPPPRAPAVLGDEPLEVLREVVRIRERALDVLLAEDLLADPQAGLEQLVAHGVAPRVGVRAR